MKRMMLLTATILCVAIATLAAPNKKEVNQLKQFLQATSARGDANYIRLGIVINDPESWRGVVWNNNGNITSIEWRDRELSGKKVKRLNSRFLIHMKKLWTMQRKIRFLK